MSEKLTLCAEFDIEIDWDDWPCYSCVYNPKGENWDEEYSGCYYHDHPSCPATGCIDYNEGICEHEKNMGNECCGSFDKNCPKEKGENGIRD